MPQTVTVDVAQQRGFTGTIRTGDHRKFSLLKGKADVVETLGAVGKAMVEVGDLNDGHGIIRQP